MQMWGRTSAKVVVPDSFSCHESAQESNTCNITCADVCICKQLYSQTQIVVHPCESRFVGDLLKERLFGRGDSRSGLASVSRADFDRTAFHRGLLNLRWRICFAGPECPEHGSWACTRAYRHGCVCEHGSTGGQSPCFPLTCPCWNSSKPQQINFSIFFVRVEFGASSMLEVDSSGSFSKISELISEAKGWLFRLLVSLRLAHSSLNCCRKAKVPYTSPPCSIQQLASNSWLPVQHHTTGNQTSFYLSAHHGSTARLVRTETQNAT